MQVLRNSNVFYYKLKLMCTFCFNQWSLFDRDMRQAFQKVLCLFLWFHCLENIVQLKQTVCNLSYPVILTSNIMRVEYEAKTSNTVTRSICSLYIHSDCEQVRMRGPSITTSITVLWKRQVSSHEDFRHKISIKLDKLPAKRDWVLIFF